MSELTKLTTRTPTEAQLDAARDWSRVYVGAPIGNKAATGCWQAMFDALPISPAPDARSQALRLARAEGMRLARAEGMRLARAEGMRAEREACAQVIENWHVLRDGDMTSAKLAKAIRARAHEVAP